MRRVGRRVRDNLRYFEWLLFLAHAVPILFSETRGESTFAEVVTAIFLSISSACH